MFVGSRRSRKRLVAQTRERLMEQQADVFAKRSMMEETIAKFENTPNLPPEIAQVIKMQMEAMMPQSLPDIPPDETLLRNDLESLADQFVGVFFEKNPDGTWKLWNFDMLIASAIHIYANPIHKDLSFTIDTPDGQQYDLVGPTAIAFLRFLHYMGLMMLEANKIPCPVCGHKAPQDCLECGGLGWVLKPLESTHE
jgi:hypothetical protein